MNIVIITRSRPFHLSRLLVSLRLHHGPRELAVTVIDDSPSRCAVQLNRDSLHRAGFDDVVHVCSQNLSRVKQLIDHTCMMRSHPCLHLGMLGRVSWNASAARNVGLMLLASEQPRIDAICLDDDVVITQPLCFSRHARPTIVGMRLEGCPDYSRLAWLMTSLAIDDEGVRQSWAANGVWSEPMDADWRDRHRVLLAKYTDLPPLTRSAPALDNSSVFAPISTGYGAAFGMSIPLEHASWFMPYPDEDHHWITAAVQHGAHAVVTPAVVRHLPATKSLLSWRACLLEELGGIASQVLQVVRLADDVPLRPNIDRLARARAAELARWRSRIVKCQVSPSLRNRWARVIRLMQRLESRVVAAPVVSGIEATLNRYKSVACAWNELKDRLAERGPSREAIRHAIGMP